MRKEEAVVGLPKVLVVDDDPNRHRDYASLFDNRVQLISATRTVQAEELLACHPDIAVIILDACVPGREPNTMPLVRRFREHFSKPIIAASCDAHFRQLLMEAGCSHEADKRDVPDFVLRLLGIAA